MPIKDGRVPEKRLLCHKNRCHGRRTCLMYEANLFTRRQIVCRGRQICVMKGGCISWNAVMFDVEGSFVQ